MEIAMFWRFLFPQLGLSFLVAVDTFELLLDLPVSVDMFYKQTDRYLLIAVFNCLLQRCSISSGLKNSHAGEMPLVAGP